MSTSFTSLAIATGFERRYGVLKRLGASPLPRVRAAAPARSGALLVVEVLQFVLIGGVALPLGWSPHARRRGARRAGCRCWAPPPSRRSGLLIAGALRAEATLAAANLVYLLLLAGGAVVFPAGSYGPAGKVLALLPSGALGSGMRTALLAGGFPVTALLVLAGWTVAGTLLTARTFTWE